LDQHKFLLERGEREVGEYRPGHLERISLRNQLRVDDSKKSQPHIFDTSLKRSMALRWFSPTFEIPVWRWGPAGFMPFGIPIPSSLRTYSTTDPRAIRRRWLHRSWSPH